MITLLTFLFFTGLVAFLTWLITRREDRSTSEGYFLAGRSLTFPFIAGSLLLTNLSTEQMVGLNGAAFTDGLAVMVWEVLAVVALVAMALYFLPRFLRLGVATVPEYLNLRFSDSTALIANLVFLIAYAFILLPIILYTGATGMIGILDVSSLLGIESFSVTLWIIIWVVGLIGATYALWGGLRTVAVSDLLNGIGLLTGGFMIVYFALKAVGGDAGVMGGLEVIRTAVPEKFNSIGGSHTSVPFSTLFTGILLLNLFYWCTNQQIIQRTFGASSLSEGQKGVLLTGGLKLLGPLYLVLPGIIAFHLYAGEGIKSDMAYGRLVFDVLPWYLNGFFAAAMLGAILSSFNSALNSTCTLFSLGLYKKILNKNANDDQVVRSGRVFGWIITLIAMLIAPLLAETGGIFAYLQKMNGIYFIPIFSVVLIGMLSRSVPSKAANAGLVAGFVIIATGYFVPPFKQWVTDMHEFHFLGAVFAVLIAGMWLWSRFAPLPTPWQDRDVRAVDMTPWRAAPLVAAVLIAIVLAVYWLFADFGAAFGR